MAVHTYVVARDYGFAPNPFGGYCTLATCKPGVRRSAQVGDWVVGTGSAVRQRRGVLVYAMKVAETMSFNSYWNDLRFQSKKPNMRASRKFAFGDNIYHRVGGHWIQLDSHHSLADGSPNPRNIRNDTKADRVLIATHFAYWGGSGPQVPDRLRDCDGHDLCIGIGFKKNFPPSMQAMFVEWFDSLETVGCVGRPLDWTWTL